jgi:hypothetical protein
MRDRDWDRGNNRCHRKLVSGLLIAAGSSAVWPFSRYQLLAMPWCFYTTDIGRCLGGGICAWLCDVMGVRLSLSEKGQWKILGRNRCRMRIAVDRSSRKWR